jgi:hypothetical protein
MKKLMALHLLDVRDWDAVTEFQDAVQKSNENLAADWVRTMGV